MKSFLMMGQSNMAGRGSFTEVEPLTDKRAFMLRNGRWQPMREPINVDRPIKMDGKLETFSGIGPAASFAVSFAQHYDEQIGLIPCADGGTSLEEWKAGGQLFLNALYQAKLAMNISELTGIIWHQGEAEASNKELAESYAERFLAMMNAFQEQLGTKLCIVVGELGHFYNDFPQKPQYVEEVNRQLNELAKLPDIAIAHSEGLQDRGDKLHFSAAAQREFGRRYFEAYKNIAEVKKQ